MTRKTTASKSMSKNRLVIIIARNTNNSKFETIIRRQAIQLQTRFSSACLPTFQQKIVYRLNDKVCVQILLTTIVVSVIFILNLVSHGLSSYPSQSVFLQKCVGNHICHFHKLTSSFHITAPPCDWFRWNMYTLCDCYIVVCVL